MPEIGQTRREIRDFPGLVLDRDVHDLESGSTYLQVNCTSEDEGTLRSRHGYVLINFEGE